MEFKVGCVYRAKKPSTVGVFRYLNDRQILWMDDVTIQYDSPAVGFGRKFPKVSREKFEKWAGSEVTDQLPKGEWARGV